MTKIGLGLAALGRPEYINIREHQNIDKSKNAFKKRAFGILTTAYGLGIRYFDTAPSYGKGETFLADWQQNQKEFLNAEFATKWGYTYVANWELGFSGAHEIKEHSISKLNEQWNISKALFAKLNVYQIHSATLESGVLENSEILLKLHELKKETGLKIGLTTSGVFQEETLKKASTITIKNEILFDVFQVTYNVFEQTTNNILNKLIQKGKHVVIKEGLANGRIFRTPPICLKNIAKKHKVGIDAVALRFIIDHLNPSVVLSGAFEEKQLIDNLKALDFKLNCEEIEQLKTLQMDTNKYWEERKQLLWN